MALCTSLRDSSPLVSLFLFFNLSVELYSQDLVKYLRGRFFREIFYKMAGSGLAPVSEDVRSFTVLLGGSKDYVCLFTATELRSCIASFETTRNLENMYLLEMTMNLLNVVFRLLIRFIGLGILRILSRC